MYGITETTVHVTYLPLSASDVNGGSVIVPVEINAAAVAEMPPTPGGGSIVTIGAEVQPDPRLVMMYDVTPKLAPRLLSTAWAVGSTVQPPVK